MYFLMEKLEPGVGLGILAHHGCQRKENTSVVFLLSYLDKLGGEMASHLQG